MVQTLWERGLGEFERESGFSFAEVRQLCSHGGFSIAYRGQDFTARPSHPELVVAMDLNTDAKGAEAVVKRLIAMDARGHEISLTGSWGAPRRLAFDGRPLRHGPVFDRIGSTVLISPREDFLKAIARPAAGRHVLSQSEEFQQSLKRVGGRAAPAVFYLNLPALRNLLASLSLRQPEIAIGIAAGNVLGLQSLDSVVAGFRPTARGHQFVLSASFPRGRDGIFALLNAGTVNPELLRLAPPNAFLAGATSIDRKAIYDTLCHYAHMVPFGTYALSVLGKVEAKLGVRIGEDLLACCSPHSAFWAAFPCDGGLVPGFVVACEMRDADRFEVCIRKIATGLGGSVRAVAHGKAKISVVDIPIQAAFATIAEIGELPLPPELREGLPMQVPRDIPEPLRQVLQDPHVTFSYVRDGKVILLADYPLALKWYLEARAQGGNLWEDPRFQAAVGKDIGTVGNFFYLRYDPIVKAAYNTLVPIAQALFGGALRSQMGVDLAQLPTARFLEEHLKGIVLTFSVEANRLEVTATGPIHDLFLPKGDGAKKKSTAKPARRQPM